MARKAVPVGSKAPYINSGSSFTAATICLHQVICVSFPTGDHINLVSSSMPSFPILQRSSEEKILYSDRLTLER